VKHSPAAGQPVPAHVPKLHPELSFQEQVQKSKLLGDFLLFLTIFPLSSGSSVLIGASLEGIRKQTGYIT